MGETHAPPCTELMVAKETLADKLAAATEAGQQLQALYDSTWAEAFSLGMEKYVK